VTFRILPAKTFPGSSERAATDDAAAWLTEQCPSGWEPHALVATGDAKRIMLSGRDGGAIVLVKK
jgi:hypothetical protein